MKGFAETPGDGVDEGSDLSEIAGLVGEFGEELFSGVGLAEETLINPLLETFGESESECEEDGEDGEDADYVDVSLVARMLEEIFERKRQPNAKKESQNVNRLAGEGVFRALTDENANVDGAMDDDDVGKGQGERARG